MSALPGVDNVDLEAEGWEPIQLKAMRPSKPLRAGHPAFTGPVHEVQRWRYGAINYDEDGTAWVLLPPLPKKNQSGAGHE